MATNWIDKETFFVTEQGEWRPEPSGILPEQGLNPLVEPTQYWRPDGIIVLVARSDESKPHYRLYVGEHDEEQGIFESLISAVNHYQELKENDD